MPMSAASVRGVSPTPPGITKPGVQPSDGTPITPDAGGEEETASPAGTGPGASLNACMPAIHHGCIEIGATAGFGV